MKRTLIILGVLLSTGAQIAVTLDIYKKLEAQEATIDTLGTFVAHQDNRYELIESTVLRHDEEIGTIKQIGVTRK